jgi:hypothetical protein
MAIDADDEGKTFLKIEDIVVSSNVAELLTKRDLEEIGAECVRGYLADRESRSEWEERQADSLKLALQVVENKSFPWQNCSNIKFPLITIAAMGFHARAYPALIDSPYVVKTYIVGADPDGSETARGERITSHMNYQLFVEDHTWEEQMDRALIALPIAGCIFKKTYFDPIKGINRSVLVLPQDLVVDYWTKDMSDVTRLTHSLKWNSNALVEKQRSGLFLSNDDNDEDDVPPQQVSKSPQENARDESQGTRDNSQVNDIYSILEQHCFLDLDGDGYKEPYIVFVREDTKEVLRIVARFLDQNDVMRVNDAAIKRYEKMKSDLTSKLDEESKKQESSGFMSGVISKASNVLGVESVSEKMQNQISDVNKEIERLRSSKDNKIIRIEGSQYFTKYSFIPSPDGGFYDIGYGTLLGPISHSIDSMINLSVDAGILKNMGGGLFGRGVKFKKGQTSFAPGEYLQIDSSGDDIAKNVYTFPFQGPSAELVSLMMFLVNYSERISGTVDIMVGENPGQNTPAETSRNMVEQGSKIFSAIYKRIRRALSEELKKEFRLNQLYLEDNVHYLDLSTGQGAMITHNDYLQGSIHVIPEADPNIASDAQKVNQANALMQMATTMPGFNLYEVVKRNLKAHRIQAIDQIYPDPKGPNAIPPQPNIKIQLAQMQEKSDQMDREINFKLEMMKLMQEAELNQAKIQQLQAKAIESLANAQGVEQGHQIAQLDAELGAARLRQEGIVQALNILQKHTQITKADKPQEITNQKE